jgi:hypothetical protein
MGIITAIKSLFASPVEKEGVLTLPFRHNVSIKNLLEWPKGKAFNTPFEYLFYKDGKMLTPVTAFSIGRSDDEYTINLEDKRRIELSSRQIGKKLVVRVPILEADHKAVREMVIAAGIENDAEIIAEHLHMDSQVAERFLIWSGMHEEVDEDGFDLRCTDVKCTQVRPAGRRMYVEAEVLTPDGVELRFYSGCEIDEIYQQGRTNPLATTCRLKSG